MRIRQANVTTDPTRIEIHFDGKPLAALAGETVSAALHANGIRSFRRTRHDNPRGLYCGMGACFDCVVTVDGRAGVRACLETVRDGQIVRSDVPLGTPEDPLVSLCELPTRAEPQQVDVDVLVVGAGPAGLGAAIAAARSGAQVVVLDERPQPGGQYFKPLAPSHAVAKPLDTQFAEGRRLTEEALSLGVRLLQKASWPPVPTSDRCRWTTGRCLV
jgi:NADPH-dependent 2,4-dienoyl-CoA reductase/sulfur reductase-like enzyme